MPDSATSLPVPAAALGEGPRWFDGALHWVDIHRRRHHRFIPADGRVGTVEEDDEVSLVLPRQRGGQLLAIGARIVLRSPDGHVRVLTTLSEDPAVRCNDGTCDPAGRLYIGLMRRDGSGRDGRLLRVDPDGRVTVIAEGCAIPNGIGFDVQRQRMYFIDSLDGGVDVWDLDDDGVPQGRRRFLDVLPPALPDGLTLDAEGHVWVAMNRGDAIHRYTPDAELVEKHELPTSQITSCTFGGPALRDLYITTAREGMDDQQRRRDPMAGALLVIRDAGRGLPVVAFDG